MLRELRHIKKHQIDPNLTEKRKKKHTSRKYQNS